MGDFAANFAVCRGCARFTDQGNGIVTCSANGQLIGLLAEAGACPIGWHGDDPVARHRRSPPMATDAEIRELFEVERRVGGCGCAP